MMDDLPFGERGPAGTGLPGHDGPRAVVCVPVQILAGGPAPARAAMMADLSETGARLEVEGWVTVPARFHILSRPHEGGNAIRISCVPCWQTASAIDVRFDPPLPADMLQLLTDRCRRTAATAN